MLLPKWEGGGAKVCSGGDSLLNNSTCDSVLKGRGLKPRRKRRKINHGFSR